MGKRASPVHDRGPAYATEFRILIRADAGLDSGFVTRILLVTSLLPCVDVSIHFWLGIAIPKASQ